MLHLFMILIRKSLFITELIKIFGVIWEKTKYGQYFLE